MRQQAGAVHHEHNALPRGSVIVGFALLSWLAVFSFWRLFTIVAAALAG